MFILSFKHVLLNYDTDWLNRIL